MLAGNLVSLGTGGLIAGGSSWMWGEEYGFEETRLIGKKQVVEEDVGQESEEGKSEGKEMGSQVVDSAATSLNSPPGQCLSCLSVNMNTDKVYFSG